MDRKRESDGTLCEEVTIMKKIMCSILLVGIILFCVACGNESSVVSLSPEEEQLNNYNTICGKLYSEQNYLGELIIQADETI